jgi:hypothetical protein
VASTDDHLGYPGAYGEGLAAVYADSLTRESIMEALRARRTYAVNGDRIRLDFKLKRLYHRPPPGVLRSRSVGKMWLTVSRSSRTIA